MAVVIDTRAGKVTGLRVTLFMESVSVWVDDDEYGRFKIAHVFRPKINAYYLEKEGDRYESAMRNSYQAALNAAVRDSVNKLCELGKFRGGKEIPKLAFDQTMSEDYF